MEQRRMRLAASRSDSSDSNAVLTATNEAVSTSGNHFGHGIRQVESLTRSARGGLPPAPSPTSGFDARTPARSYALTLARRVASSRCAVLIVGPTGVGKEVLAEEIHRRGDRAGKRFLAINCAAIAPSLFESTFFGHTRGAFSGATSDKPGLVELANGGTLFLDEVGELSLDAQAKLLRFLAKGTYWPVGGTSEQHVDVRVIAATHRDIGAEDTKSFREDLFYRLSTITIRIPGLDARDVETIARSIATEVAESHGVVISEDDAMALTTRCAAHEWKGGVRELRNAIERLMILWNPGRPREEVFAEVLGQRPSPSSPSPHVPSVNVSKDLDNLLFLGVAEQCADVKELASRTERTVQAIYGRLKKLDLTPQDVGPTPRLEARKANLRRRLAPELPWIQRLLTE